MLKNALNSIVKQNSMAEVARLVDEYKASLPPHSTSASHGQSISRFQSFYDVYSGPARRALLDLCLLQDEMHQRLVDMNQDSMAKQIANRLFHDFRSSQDLLEQLLTEALEFRDWAAALHRISQASLQIMLLVLQARAQFSVAFWSPPAGALMDEVEIATAKMEEIINQNKLPCLFLDAQTLDPDHGRNSLTQHLTALVNPFHAIRQAALAKKYHSLAAQQAMSAEAQALGDRADDRLSQPPPSPLGTSSGSPPAVQPFIPDALDDQTAALFRMLVGNHVVSTGDAESGSSDLSPITSLIDASAADPSPAQGQEDGKMTLYEELLRHDAALERGDEGEEEDWEEVPSKKMKGKQKGGKGKSKNKGG